MQRTLLETAWTVGYVEKRRAKCMRRRQIARGGANTNELTEEQQLHAVEQEQTGRAARGEATGLSRRIY